MRDAKTSSKTMVPDLDAAQEECLRASRFFDGYQGGYMRARLISIVRNTLSSWLHKNRQAGWTELFGEEIHNSKVSGGADPVIYELASAERETLNPVLEEVPGVFREAPVLRGMECMSYKEIDGVASVSTGMVMSRLARARTRLRQALSAELSRGY